MSKTELLEHAEFKVWWYANKHFLLLFLEHKVHSVQDLMFSYWCCWRFKSSEMLGHVDWYTVVSVSEDHSAFIFRDEQSKKRNDLPVNITYPRTHEPSRLMQWQTLWHKITSLLSYCVQRGGEP